LQSGATNWRSTLAIGAELTESEKVLTDLYDAIIGRMNMNARARLLEAIETLSEERIAQILEYAKLIRDQEELRKRNWQVTVEAMEAARRGEHVKVDGIEGLMAYLHADDNADA
jgi:hypothetical protein